jgi:AcrR family transcriptional regulator
VATSRGNGRADKKAAHARPADAELTPRGARTKAALLAAARTVFERDGFLNARITDIAEEAEVAHGTFYTYFPDKNAIFQACVEALQGDFHEPDQTPRPPDETVYEAILRANRRYYEIYKSRGRMMGIVEQVATFNDELRAMRRQIRQRFVERSERSIRRWQGEGLADPVVDARYAANALGSMVDRTIYTWIVLGEPHDPEVALATLSRLWVNALGLPAEEREPRVRAESAVRPGRQRTPRAATERTVSAAAAAPAGGKAARR